MENQKNKIAKQTVEIINDWKDIYRSKYLKSYNRWIESMEPWEALEKLKKRAEGLNDERAFLEKQVRWDAQNLLKDKLQFAFDDLTFQIGELDKEAVRKGLNRQNKLRPRLRHLFKRLDEIFGSDSQPPSLFSVLFDRKRDQLLKETQNFLNETSEVIDLEARFDIIFDSYRKYVEKHYEWQALRTLISDIERGNYSNASKLAEADGWIAPLLRRMTDLPTPTEEQVLNIINDEFPGFKLEFIRTSLKTPLANGNLIKTSIAEAIKFIFEQKNPDEEITTDAIRKRYNKKNLW